GWDHRPGIRVRRERELLPRFRGLRPAWTGRKHRHHHTLTRQRDGLRGHHRFRQSVAMRRPESGFTVVEVLVAMIILTVGALALVQSAAGVTKMLRYGRLGTRAAVVASTRLESLRNDALSTT